MAYTQTPYATLTQFKAFIGRTDDASGNDDAKTLVLNAASLMIDRATGSWFNSRAASITLTGVLGSKYLQLPAPIITLTSVTEDGDVLVSGTDFYKRRDYLEKLEIALWSEDLRRAGNRWWSIKPDDVVVIGTFGRTTPPEDVVALTCAIAGAIGEYRRRVFQNEDGSISEVPTSAMPAWINDKLSLLRARRMGPSNSPVVTYT